MKKMHDNAIKYISFGIFFSLVIFVLFGVISALIPTRYFTRMIESKNLDYLFLTLTSLLLGSYISLSIYQKNRENKCDYIMGGGTILGFFSFGCPICNVFLVSIFGASAILTYLEPYRPVFGLISIGLLGFIFIYKMKELKKGSH
jgi:uncharacterized membrane protein